MHISINSYYYAIFVNFGTIGIQAVFTKSLIQIGFYITYTSIS